MYENTAFLHNVVQYILHILSLLLIRVVEKKIKKEKNPNKTHVKSHCSHSNPVTEQRSLSNMGVLLVFIEMYGCTFVLWT